MTRLVLACAALLAWSTSSASAENRFWALPSPIAPLSAAPPVGGGATTSAEGVRHRVSAASTVEVSLDAAGAPFAVVATQRLEVRRLGDYLFTIGAPLTNVEAAAGSAATPGLRTGAFLWEGFNPGHRRLAARVTLDAAAVGPALPLRVSVSGGRATLENATATVVTTSSADAPTGALAAYMRSLRAAAASGAVPTGGGTEITSSLRPVRVRVSAPLAVDGTVGARRVHVVLGGAKRPAKLVVPAGRIRLTVRPLPPTELLAPAAGEPGRTLLGRAALASLEFARSRQYNAFLGNPDPVGATRTTYVYRSAARPVPAVVKTSSGGGRSWLATTLVALGAVAALALATVAWSRA
jgi:hypothetical protein